VGALATAGISPTGRRSRSARCSSVTPRLDGTLRQREGIFRRDAMQLRDEI
jgi:hypothetical protein